MLLNVYFSLIGRYLGLRGTKSELVIGGFVAFIEGSSLLLIMTFFPDAISAMIVPVIVGVLVYKITHHKNYWNNFDIGMLLAFRAIIIGFPALLISGNFYKGFLILFGFGLLLIIISLINDLSE